MTTIAEGLKSQFDILKGQEGYFVKDQKNIQYFALNPANTDQQEILTKISATNNKELNDVSGAQSMAEHILKLNIDKRLQENDLSLVEDIANININGQNYRLLTFASVYCNYHKPDVYPIYSNQHNEFLKEYVNELMPDIDVNRLDDYIVRKKILDDIIKRFFSDKDVNYFEARKFGWLYLDKFIQEYYAGKKA